ncbi:cupin-like domain-containing protein [Sphingomonas sp. CBMAI 2297]|uniref:cupin-like domain-containing protein n=1 Tax=Sphingomonas sp. CBMAI 2297 TaxID=2991720 RepID=UPI002453D7B0|nr:cupin-like domain-containing protein [Sphingomonas sp. CBMAI 2297]MDH4746417.1 cupin-like domain-containing protein [Sphingomonas sp. CBMAI 2297]
MAEPLRRAAAAEPGLIDGLPRVSARAAPPAAGLADLIAAGVPIVLKGLFAHWPALAAGQAGQLPAYLKGLDRGAPVPVMEAPARTLGKFGYGIDLREFNFTRRSARLSDALDRILRLAGEENAPHVAVQMLPLAVQMPDFVAQNPMPLLPVDVAPRLWVGGPVHTRTHNDRDHNLACVLAGRRRFLLFPPDQVANLYVGPLDNPPPLSLVDPEAPDLARFPRFADALATARVAFLDPGDALFLPRYWWHHVTSLSPFNAMVNYWWGDDAMGVEQPHDVFLAALLAYRRLPPAERGYWRAMFETHVFAEDGAVHIPPSQRGPLGEMRASERAALRQRLRAAFLKS